MHAAFRGREGAVSRQLFRAWLSNPHRAVPIFSEGCWPVWGLRTENTKTGCPQIDRKPRPIEGGFFCRLRWLCKTSLYLNANKTIKCKVWKIWQICKYLPLAHIDFAVHGQCCSTQFVWTCQDSLAKEINWKWLIRRLQTFRYCIGHNRGNWTHCPPNEGKRPKKYLNQEKRE